MHMRYHKYLYIIKEKYEEILNTLNSGTEEEKNRSMRKFHVTTEDIIQIQSELKALIYLVSLKQGYVHKDDGVGVYKPDNRTIQNLFNRYIRYLQTTYNVERNTKQTPYNKIALKTIQCCYYYLFKFSLPAWVEKLPEYITVNTEK